MNSTGKELRQQRAKLINEMHDLCEKTSFTAESKKRWSELDEQQKGMMDTIQRMETIALDDEMHRVISPPQPQINSSPSICRS